MTLVVDTNVAIAANGRETHADEECQLACVQQLEALEQEIVAIDDGGLILEEYGKNLNHSGNPGMGDKFFKYVRDHQYWENRICMVPVTESKDDRRGFKELPENTFDRSDRKFLAVAVVAKATVLNATDSDWGEHKELTDKLNVEVEQLCPQHAKKRTRRKR